MAPLTLRVAKEAYDKCVTELKWSCHTLERILPPPSDGEQASFPPSKPRLRLDSVAACERCALELEALDAGERAGHQCTHGERRGSDSRSVADQEEQRRAPARGKVRQPKLRVVQEYLGYLTESLKAYTGAVGNVCSVLTREEDKNDYEDLMLLWVDYCEDVKERARDNINVLEAAQLGATQNLPLNPVSGDNVTLVTSEIDEPTFGGSGVNASQVSLHSSQEQHTELLITDAPAILPNPSSAAQNQNVMTVVSAVTQPPIMAATVASVQKTQGQSSFAPGSFVVGLVVLVVAQILM